CGCPPSDVASKSRFVDMGGRCAPLPPLNRGFTALPLTYRPRPDWVAPFSVASRPGRLVPRALVVLPRASTNLRPRFPPAPGPLRVRGEGIPEAYTYLLNFAVWWRLPDFC